MSNVVSINEGQRRIPFEDYTPRVRDEVLEGIKFLGGVAITLWAPTLLFCYVIGLALLGYLAVGAEVLGVAWGVILFTKSSSGLLSCVPINRVPDVPRSAKVLTMPKAA